MPIIDAHAHLDELEDVHSALKDAKDKGVEGVVAVSMDMNSCRKNLEICRQYSNSTETSYVRLALGIHPSEIKKDELEQTCEFIEKNAVTAAAIGEIGLDYWDKNAKKDESVRKKQLEVFETMIGIALAHKKPVIVHSRGAWNECFETLVKHNVKSAVFHWYSGPRNVLEKIIEAGYYVSMTPALEYSKDLIAAANAAPLERIMVETDTPVYGWKPADVLRSVRRLAEIKGISPESAAEQTSINARKFFGI